MEANRVNPTRVELKKLQKRLTTARRGCKLLKDKRDELLQQFIALVRDTGARRHHLEQTLRHAYTGLAMAASVTDPNVLRAALLVTQADGNVTVGTRRVLNVEVPTFSQPEGTIGGGEPFGYAFTSGELDAAMEEMRAISGELIRLAEDEKALMTLSDELESTRRRVNALEHIMIPQYEAAIHTITMKLDENDRGERTRLMKVKEMMHAKAHPAVQER